ncbi:MAG: hypothetical protein WC799_21735 [Desulfobacteraceae bacterium]|jgi:hypothetical protein
MKTVKCSLLLVCLLFLLGVTSSSTCTASDIKTGPLAALDNTTQTNDLNDDEVVEENDDFDFDYEQYAYDEGGDDDTYVDDQGEDSDLEPAPELDDPTPGTSGDDSAEPAPEPESSDEE